MIKLPPVVPTVLALGVFAACAGSAQDASNPTAPAESPTAAPASETPTVEPTQETPAPTQPPAGAGGGGGQGTVVPAPTPASALPVVPDDWATYSDPCGLFTVSYPPSWFVLPGGDPCELVSVILSSFELGTVGPQFPPNSIKVDVAVFPLNTDITGCEPPGSAPISVGGITGWQTIQTYDPARSSGVTRTHEVALDRNGFRYCLGANFAQENPDTDTFLQIVNSLKFTK